MPWAVGVLKAECPPPASFLLWGQHCPRAGFRTGLVLGVLFRVLVAVAGRQSRSQPTKGSTGLPSAPRVFPPSWKPPGDAVTVGGGDLSVYPSLTWHPGGLDVLLGGPERGCLVQRDDLLVMWPRHCHSFSQQTLREYLPTYLPA